MSFEDAFHTNLNLDPERALLGAILLAPASIHEVMPILDEDDFRDERHRRIYGTMLALLKRKAAIDLVTVKDEASRNGGHEKAGGIAYISGLLDGVPDIGNVEHYARIVKKESVRRRLFRAGQKLTQGAASQEQDAAELLAEFKAEILDIEHTARKPDEGAQRSPLRSHTLAQLEAMKIPERELIASPILARQETLFVYGPKGASKTWIGTGIATVAAQGGGARFLNFVNDGPGVLTLYVDGEMLSRDIRQRCRDVCRTAGLNPGDNLRIWTPDAQPEGTPPLNLFTEQGREMLENHLADIEQEAARKVELVVIDNLRTLCPGWEENAAESFMPIAVWTIRLRAGGKATALLHHSNKTGGYSGNTAIVSTVHAILKVARPEGYTADQGASFDLAYEWTRARPEGLENFSARLEGDEWSLTQTGHVADELIRILTVQGLSIRAIADQIGKGRDYIARAQKRLGLTKGTDHEAPQ